MGSRELISPAEYARRRGVTRAGVSKAIKRCGIPVIDGKIDALVADVLWKARTDPDQQRRALAQNLRPQPAAGPTSAADPISDDDYRRRRERAEAQLAELELAEREAALVKAESVQRTARRVASAVVMQLDSVADRIAAEFGLDDAHRRKIRQRIIEELQAVRAEFARAGLLAEQ